MVDDKAQLTLGVLLAVLEVVVQLHLVAPCQVICQKLPHNKYLQGELASVQELANFGDVLGVGDSAGLVELSGDE